MLQAYVLNVSVISDVCFKCFIWILHNMQFQAYVFKCFGCFIDMLQVFHLNIVKVDLDAVYI
jgi:hypothetical protein